jgi:signal transduction histidine kinase
MSEEQSGRARFNAIAAPRIPELAAELGNVPVFGNVAQPDLEWFIAECQEICAEAGEVIIEEGSPADKMYVLLEGELRGRREKGPDDGMVFTISAGNIGGILPFSRMKTFAVTARAVVRSRGLGFPSAKFGDLIQRLPDLTQRLIGMLTDRVRDFTRTEQQKEKLAALGKLSAGLAHELNNPSAAARRSASALRDCLDRLRSADRKSRIGAKDCADLAECEERIRTQLKPAAFKDEFERVEREEALEHWLESHHVEEPWKLAPLLAEASLADAHLEEFAGPAGESLGPELLRFGTLLEMERIADELEHSTARISDLIKAIKEYSYMDQAPLQEVDLRNSLETTLTIMRHKLKRAITVKREFPEQLPKVMAYGSELNQVWTNLIDNAADAMAEKGVLTIRAWRENEFAAVEIADDGPGIPAEVQSRIFEPFFTTKGVGNGTGLGLDIVHRIIQKMHGTVTFKSAPGDTRFLVRLPLRGRL